MTKPYLDSWQFGVGRGGAPPDLLDSPWGTVWHYDPTMRLYRTPGGVPKTHEQLLALWECSTIPWVTTPLHKLVARAGDRWLVVAPQVRVAHPGIDARAATVPIPKPGVHVSIKDYTWLIDVVHRDVAGRFAERVAHQIGEISAANLEHAARVLG